MLYRNQLPEYFKHFLPLYGMSRYPSRYDGIHLTGATREFCEINAKYKLHVFCERFLIPLLQLPVTIK